MYTNTHILVLSAQTAGIYPGTQWSPRLSTSHTPSSLDNWAATCDFQQCVILTSVYSDEPVQPPFKIRNSKWCSVSSLTLIEYASDKQRLWSDCAYAQADLRLCWSHIPHCWKSHVTAHILKLYNGGGGICFIIHRTVWGNNLPRIFIPQLLSKLCSIHQSRSREWLQQSQGEIPYYIFQWRNVGLKLF